MADEHATDQGQGAGATDAAAATGDQQQTDSVALPDRDGATASEPKPYDWAADPHKLKDVQLGDFRLAGKYESVEALEQAYTNANSLIGKKKEELAKEFCFAAPEAYDFGDASKDWDEPTKTAVQAEFKALGLSQEQAAKALPKLVEMAEALNVANTKQALMEEWNLTGSAFESHIGKVAQWGQERLPSDVYDRFRTMGVHGVLAVEALMKAGTEMPVWGGTPAPASADLRGELAEVEAKLFRPPSDAPLTKAQKDGLLARRSEIYKLLYPGDQPRAGKEAA